ncbi:hypothetical protein ADUPG1_011679, partial [Aduncisulcus paluster]
LQNMLPPSQACFGVKDGTLKHLSYIDCISSVSELQGKPLYGALIDISNAFSDTDPVHAMKALIHGGAPPRVMSYMRSAWEHTHAFMRGRAGIIDKDINCGVIQGDPLSAPVFAIVIKEAMNKMTEVLSRGRKLVDVEGAKDYRVLAYADDLIAVSPNVDLLDEAIKVLSNEIAKLGLSLNPAKTVLVRLSSHSPVSSLCVEGNPSYTATSVDCCKYLGAHIGCDRKLCYQNTKDYIKGVLEELENICKVLPCYYAYTLARICILPRMAYLLRVCHVDAKDLAETDRSVVDILRKHNIIRDDVAPLSIFGKIREAGLGIPSAERGRITALIKGGSICRDSYPKLFNEASKWNLSLAAMQKEAQRINDGKAVNTRYERYFKCTNSIF